LRSGPLRKLSKILTFQANGWKPFKPQNH